MNDQPSSILGSPTIAVYQAPELTLIGGVADVVLGVMGSGDDLMGYSFPPFEFESDEPPDEPIANRR